MTAEDEARARAAGLDIAWDNHREDVREAIATARRMTAGFRRPTDPAVEPTPAFVAPAPEPVR